MNFQQLSPYIRLAMDSHIPFPWYLEERVLFDYELLYVKEGRIQVTVENDVFIGESGDLFLFRPKQRHSIRKLGTELVRQPHLHFDLFYKEDSPDVKVSFKKLEDMTADEMKWFRNDDLEQIIPQIPSHIRLRNTLVIERIIFEIIKEFQMTLPFYEMNIKGLFLQLLNALLRENYWNCNPHLVTNMGEMEQLRMYLNHNIDRKVTLDELSKISGISKYYMISLFKQSFGKSPIQYHLLLRIEKAKEMIQFTNDPLTLIAESVGFPDIHSFSKAFKKIDGVNPSFYRKKKIYKHEHED
ncbi:AraC family transcriptional regulator [Paenibacillus woosongensis]|uniref:AraC family transcriptional regulator n=1 Tax=Paenibacillus woosongensis TaxID=307580 RepID=A0AA95I5Y0_9BACL|nr:AraC family transcriptional regulator [Paenibacillus woosongensis]WHX47923.1 AraC family transcriptional regulator [Paenibacillus woosongensis]